MPKDDVHQLVGILSQFDQTTIDAALRIRGATGRRPRSKDNDLVRLAKATFGPTVRQKLQAPDLAQLAVLGMPSHPGLLAVPAVVAAPVAAAAAVAGPIALGIAGWAVYAEWDNDAKLSGRLLTALRNWLRGCDCDISQEVWENFLEAFDALSDPDKEYDQAADVLVKACENADDECKELIREWVALNRAEILDVVDWW